MAVDWYGLDPRRTPWSQIPEPELVSKVMRHNQGAMSILLDPDFTQIAFDKFRSPAGEYITAVIVDADRVVRWVGAAHDVVGIRRALESLAAPVVTGSER